MKDKIIIFIIGLLLGAIISTGSIYFYTVATNATNHNQPQMQAPGGTPPEMPNGQNNNGGQPPEMSNNNTQENNA